MVALVYYGVLLTLFLKGGGHKVPVDNSLLNTRKFCFLIFFLHFDFSYIGLVCYLKKI